MVSHFCAHAQLVRPKWVDNLKQNGPSNSVTYLAVDKQNNVYVTGEFWGTMDADPSAGVKNLTSVGDYDIFIGKYKQDGSLIWAESIGGTSADVPYGLAVDKDGNVSIVGYFDSSTLDANPGTGVYDLNNSKNNEIGFLIHLDTNGDFLWANSYDLISDIPNQGGSSFGVATDSEDNVITTSNFGGTITIGDSTYTSRGFDGLVAKYGAAGNVLWSIHLPSTYDGVQPFDVRVDSQDNVLTSGTFAGTVNLNPLGAAYNLTAPNTTASSFVAKYSPSGSLIWANNIIEGAPGYAFLPTAICIDQQDNIYFSRQFATSLAFGSVSVTATGNNLYTCIAKYSSVGIVQFAKAIAVGQGDFLGESDPFGGPCELAADQNNNIYLTGAFRGTINFNMNTGTAENLTAHGPQDFFVAKYDANGNYIHAFNCGPPNSANASTYTSGISIAVDNDNNIDVGGAFGPAVNFDPTGCSTDTITAVALNGYEGFFAQYGTITVANNVITSPTVNSFCTSGTPTAITGSLPTGGSGIYTYQWLSSADSVTFAAINGANSQNYTPPTLTATTYYERVVSSDTCTTPSESNVVKITISNPPPTPVVASDTTCNGSTATLSVTSPQTGATYNWYADTTSTTSLFTGTSFTTPALTATTTYYVAATNSTECISATRAAATVTILPALAVPVVTLASATASSVIFTWSAVPGATGYQVSTDGGQTYKPHAGLTDTISGLLGGQSVTITVEAIGSIACQLSSASAAVTGQTVDVIYCPNAFTPNGDGRNDTWTVEGANIQSLKFYIYDQWGELLFSSTSTQNGWDGTYKGTKEPVGVYVYYLEAVMNDGQNVRRKGTITLLK